MNHFISCTTLGIGIATMATAQVRVNDPKQTAERNVEYRVNSKVDQGINKGIDKIEQGIGNIFKKKEKQPKATKPSDDTYSDQPTNDQAAANSSENSGSSNPAPVAQPDEPKALRAYSKFDFVPGQNVIAMDDFSQDAIGDFPARWNTNASGEVVTLEGRPGKWLAISQNGLLYPEFLGNLPDNFTLELDMVITEGLDNNKVGTAFSFIDSRATKNRLTATMKNGVKLEIHPGGGYTNVTAWDADEEVRITNENYQKEWLSGEKPTAKLSIWRQKTRLRVYLNEVKIWDVPRAFDPAATYQLLMERGFFTTENQAWYVGNFRVAVGAPDTRSKLMSEGKFTTTGILFDVNSDKIKPESFGILKELGSVLTENAGLRVRIIGHTDSDGDDAQNLALSKRRATAVKNALATEFGIKADRMETDGKGETQPVGPNTTLEGKANNRRVEFIKL